MGCLEIGDDARETILDPGTKAEKIFFEEPKPGFMGRGIFVLPHCEFPFGTGDNRLL